METIAMRQEEIELIEKNRKEYAKHLEELRKIQNDQVIEKVLLNVEKFLKSDIVLSRSGLLDLPMLKLHWFDRIVEDIQIRATYIFKFDLPQKRLGLTPEPYMIISICEFGDDIIIDYYDEQSKLVEELVLNKNQNQNLYKMYSYKYKLLKENIVEKRQDTTSTSYSIKNDKSKPKYSQVPVECLNAICEVADYGNIKYPVGNWVNVEAERFVEAGLRHIFAMQSVEDNGKEKVLGLDLSKKDSESGIEHLKHALCSLAYAVSQYERNKGE